MESDPKRIFTCSLVDRKPFLLPQVGADLTKLGVSGA